MRKAISVPFIYQKRGIFYFSRRVPKDLEAYYRCSKIALSLRTKSLKAAKAKSASLASQLEEEWLTLRWRRNDSPLRKFLRYKNLPTPSRSDPLASIVASPRITSLNVSSITLSNTSLNIFLIEPSIKSAQAALDGVDGFSCSTADQCAILEGELVHLINRAGHTVINWKSDMISFGGLKR